MKNLFARWASVCAALLLWSASAHTADEQHHILWSLQGKTNKVYLLGSVHLLKENEKLPAAIDSAYADADKLVMEIDMDDLDPVQMQQDVMDLAALPEGQTLQQQLGPQIYDAESVPAVVRRDHARAAAADEDGLRSRVGR